MAEIATVPVAQRGNSAAELPQPSIPPLLRVEELRVAFPLGGEWLEVVRGVDLTIGRGEMVGLVGESGSGKSSIALALLRLVSPPCRVSGRVLLDGEDLLGLPEGSMRRVRGARVGMVFQEPFSALNPVLSIGFQIAEAVRCHRRVSRGVALAEAARLLDRVAIPDAPRRLADYPHQLSGGQRQRVMLAMALASGPDLLLADEPSTALDMTVQAQILELLDELRAELGLAVLLITHDLSVVAERCGRVVVLYAGQVVEEARAGELFGAPAHPYSRGLLATLPRPGSPAPRGQLPVLPGQPASPRQRPSGCAFHPRCGAAMPVCGEREPVLVALAPPAPPLPGSRAPAGSGRAASTLLPRQAEARSDGLPAAPQASTRVRCWLYPPASAEARG